MLRGLALLPLLLVASLVWWTSTRPMPIYHPVSQHAHRGSIPQQGGTNDLPAVTKSGWKLQGKMQRFNQKTLFDRIDGAAPVFLEAGFVFSLGAEYKKPGQQDGIVVDLYNMGGVARAFGMYAKERDPGYTFIDVGTEGYLATGSLNFWQGAFYVKLAGFEEGEGMNKRLKELAQDIAFALAQKSPPKLDELAPLQNLPEKNRLPHTEGYAHAALEDIAGLQNAFYAEYPQGEGHYRLFWIPCKDEHNAQDRLQKVYGHLQKNGAKVQMKQAEAFLFAEEEGAQMFVMHKKRILTGALGLHKPDLWPALKNVLLSAIEKNGENK